MELRARRRRSGVRLKTNGQYCFLPLLHPMEERDGERRDRLSRIPISSVLSAFLPHGEEEEINEFCDGLSAPSLPSHKCDTGVTARGLSSELIFGAED